VRSTVSTKITIIVRKKKNLLGGDRILWEELGKNLDDVSTVKHTLGTKVTARGRGSLKNEDVGKCHIPNMHIGLDGVGICLSRAG
jgi:hypothetical protein